MMWRTWCRLRWILQHRMGRECHTSSTGNKKRYNEINIQMLSEALYKQIFKQEAKTTGSVKTSQRPDEGSSNKAECNTKTNDHRQFDAIEEHLSDHNLWGREGTTLDDLDFDLPKLFGKNIDDHFRHLGKKQTEDYIKLVEKIVKSKMPDKPKKWEYTAGWTKYGPKGEATSVDFPEEEVFVFDIECLVQEGNYPTMATAVTDKYWYSWCSENLTSDKFHWSEGLHVSDLIPLEKKTGMASTRPGNKRIVIGHNVGFDRSFVKEQYFIKKTNTRFLDTMSLHIAVCGLTNFQRLLYKASQTNSQRKEVREWNQRHHDRVIPDDWKEVSTLNNLNDVYQLHCGGEPLKKATREVFVEGNMEDVREQFQDLMDYCSSDVEATLKVFKVLWPEFNKRFPHPVTLAGMLEMGTSYLPVNQNWGRYINQSNTIYQDMQKESKQLLKRLANNACEYIHNDEYKSDPWLWDLDWSVKELKLKKPDKKSTKEVEETDEIKDETEEDRVHRVLALQDRHYKTTSSMLGYPEWYRCLCPKPKDVDWEPGPAKISPQTRITPKLMRLIWDGFPVHYDETHGWGYLVPGRTDNLTPAIEGETVKKERLFPFRELHELMQVKVSEEYLKVMTDEEFEAHMNREAADLDFAEILKHWENTGIKKKAKKNSPLPDEEDTGHHGDGPYNSVDIPGCWFYKIPHKDGKGKRVGNPLAKDYLNRVEDGTLKALSGEGSERVLKLNKASSYWKMNQKRIESQMVVWLKKSDLPKTVTRNDDYEEDGLYGAIVPRIVTAGTITRRAVEPTWLTASNAYVRGNDDYEEDGLYGAIVPRIVTAGTITRRAVEPTWLTASNAYPDRVGSELKSMVQAPPGYHFVGADVDSQELWIAAVLGDAHFAKMHGCTALGWMTLQGKKSDKTDLHSKVAETVGISRDHAKVFNYGRIYGAGQKFAEKLLMQFNHRLSPEEAKSKANIMFTTTKGRRSRQTGKWCGGSESAMFNRLEEIAKSEEPCTPVLGGRISKALEPDTVYDDFMTSRINWVVQSSAVDYLHLMLVCMRWLFDSFGIDGRFSISIHDEVRYLVATEDRYRAALALHITNLLTRSMFAYKIGMIDLPQSVAFFSAVDIDVCLRKETDLDCKTPSNPHGLEKGYNIPTGEALDIYKVLELTNGSLKKQEPEPYRAKMNA